MILRFHPDQNQPTFDSHEKFGCDSSEAETSRSMGVLITFLEEYLEIIQNFSSFYPKRPRVDFGQENY